MTIYYSCDSHVVEPPEVFQGLEERFGERAPRIVNEANGRRGTFLVWPKQNRAIPVGRFGIAGHRLDEPGIEERIARGWDGMNPGVRDPIARLNEQEADGIVGEVMYPSLNMLTFSIPDREVVQTVFQRHNDWIRDYCSAAPERLIGVACLPLPDVEESIAELQRVAKMGIRGVAIPCTAPVDKPYSDPAYEPFWVAAEEVGLPITMHIFCGADWRMGAPAHWNEIVSYTLAHAAIWKTVSDIVTSGVVERHSRLRFICAEWETGWLAHVLRRWDHAVYRARREASPNLTLQSSEYFRRNFYATFEDDDIGIRTRDLIGVDRLLWGNDYPHHDSIWPHSRQILNRIMQGVPQEEVEMMVWKNVQQLYAIDESKLPMTAGV
jgi:predicted TIM-barrel fold metal-dependent hydrolase